LDEEDFLKETDKSFKGYELDEDEYEYEPILKEEKL
jgi:hypothetical protein